MPDIPVPLVLRNITIGMIETDKVG